MQRRHQKVIEEAPALELLQSNGKKLVNVALKPVVEYEISRRWHI